MQPAAMNSLARYHRKGAFDVGGLQPIQRRVAIKLWAGIAMRPFSASGRSLRSLHLGSTRGWAPSDEKPTRGPLSEILVEEAR